MEEGKEASGADAEAAPAAAAREDEGEQGACTAEKSSTQLSIAPEAPVTLGFAAGGWTSTGPAEPEDIGAQEQADSLLSAAIGSEGAWDEPATGTAESAAAVPVPVPSERVGSCEESGVGAGVVSALIFFQLVMGRQGG